MYQIQLVDPKTIFKKSLLELQCTKSNWRIQKQYSKKSLSQIQCTKSNWWIQKQYSKKKLSQIQFTKSNCWIQEIIASNSFDTRLDGSVGINCKKNRVTRLQMFLHAKLGAISFHRHSILKMLHSFALCVCVHVS